MPREDREATEYREPRLTSKFKGSRPLQAARESGSKVREEGKKAPEAIHGQNPGEKRLGSRCNSELQASLGTQPDPAPQHRESVDGESEAGLLSPRWACEPERSAQLL